MTNYAIKTYDLGKKYRIGKTLQRNLREDLTGRFKNPFKKKQQFIPFWALRHQNITINKGEAVALIGPNGSGKSTLLKMLARVTWPSEGKIEIYGRVAALLEVGTGFHVELNGRENIFLSGAILGMSRAEVQQHFDEIVAFSGVEKFLDTPIKRYSSGMFLRLAFSVMAHLKSDILIVDEILAVGDQEFQEKCMQKMQTLLEEGRTIIFVSHQLDKVAQLCSRVIWLENGQLKADGKAEEILPSYQNNELVKL